MAIRKKSPEELEAQAAAFASENVESHADFSHVMKNLDSIIDQGLKDVEKTAEKDEWVRKDGKYVKAPKGTKRTIASKEEYVKFLRAEGGSEAESIRGRIHLLEEYEAFSEDIERLKKELLDSENPEKHPSFIGSGSNSSVFTVEKEGKRYAVRVPHGKTIDPAAIDSHLAGAVLGRGIPHFEQIVAASYKDGVTVAEMMPGKEVGQLDADGIGRISERQLADFVQTLVTAREKGIMIDPKPSNFFYDPDAGFGIVDYHSEKQKSSGAAPQELGSVVGWGLSALTGAGSYGRPHKSVRSAEDFAAELTRMSAKIPKMEIYRRVVEETIPDPAKQTALAEIDKSLASMREGARLRADPAWVAEQIAREEAWEKERIEAAKKRKDAGPGDEGTIIIGWDTV